MWGWGRDADACLFTSHFLAEKDWNNVYVFLSETAYKARSDLLEIIMSLTTFTNLLLYSGIIDI